MHAIDLMVIFLRIQSTVKVKQYIFIMELDICCLSKNNFHLKL